MKEDEDFLNIAVKELEQAAMLMKNAAQTVAVLQTKLNIVTKQLDEYALLLFQPQGEAHHNANECPYCKEWLNKNKSKEWVNPYEDKMYE